MAKKKENGNFTKRFQKGLQGVSTLLNDLSTSLYGTDMDDESDLLNDRFNSIMQTQMNNINGDGAYDYSSFVGQLYDIDKSQTALFKELNAKMDLDSRSNGLNPAQFISEKYRDRMLKQADANQISNQLIELREAKSTMADAILCTDLNTGRINRNITFEKQTTNNIEDDYLPIIEQMEAHFDTPKMIKDFIVDSTLGYGENYVYTIPYHELFNDFADRYKTGNKSVSGRFFESTDDSLDEMKIEYLTESTEEKRDKAFYESIEEDISSVIYSGNARNKEESVRLKSDVETLISSDRISVSTKHIPIPILEDGLDALKELRGEYITEDGNYFEESKTSKKDGEVLKTDEDVYLRKYGSDGYYGDGLYDPKANKNTKFDEIKDCYIKIIDPTHMRPVEIMGKTLFYIYIQTEDDTPLDTILSYTNQMKDRDPSNKVDRLTEDIATRIVSKFDKEFVKKNKEFRELIVSALQYYDMGNTKVHFQVIPKEYVTEFKINCDSSGHGHSMLEPSLFYAKLYLMILMFKVITIITKSNDQTINYLRQSGIDKNTYNKVQKISRQKQARRITVNDMFSYTGFLNKMAAGSEIFMPLTKNGDRPIESEVLQGQDVQLNSDLLDLLRNAYILGTGVPSAIMNYLNEADFAKSIETANTKMVGRVVNYQIDFNKSLTELYRKLLRFSTNIPEDVIQSVNFVLPAPKGSSNVTTQELINNYQTLEGFLIKLYFGDNPDEGDEHMREFRSELAKLHLPMINFTEIDEIFKATKLKQTEKSLDSNEEEDMEM